MSDAGTVIEAGEVSREALLRPRVHRYSTTYLGTDGEPVTLSGYVRALSAGHLASVSAFLDGTADGDKQAAAELVSHLTLYCATDSAGARLFQDDEIDAVRSIDFARVEAIGEIAVQYSGLMNGHAAGDDDSGN